MYFASNGKLQEEFPYIKESNVIEAMEFIVGEYENDRKETEDRYEKLIEYMWTRQESLKEKNGKLSDEISKYRKNNKAVKIQLIIFMILFFAAAIVLGIMHFKYKVVEFQYMSCVSAIFGVLLLTIYYALDK